MSALPRLTAMRASILKPLLGAALTCALVLPLALPCQAQAISDDPVLKRMDSVLEENARLREDAWKARKQGKEAAKQADDALAASDERVEKTRTEALAHVAGVSPAQVDSLRKDGRSWGQAAGELGVHPGFLGVGKTPIYEPRSVRAKAAAEARQAKIKGKKGAKAAAKAETKADKKSKKQTKAEAKSDAKAVKKSAKGQKAKAEPESKSPKKSKKSKKAE